MNRLLGWITAAYPTAELSSGVNEGYVSLIGRDLAHSDVAEVGKLISTMGSKLVLLRCILSVKDLSEVVKNSLAVDSRLDTLVIRQSGITDEVLRMSFARNISLPVKWLTPE